MGFFDDITDRKELLNKPVLKKISDIPNKNLKLVLGVGTPNTKSILINKFINLGFEFEIIIHPTSYISPYTKIGKGAVIQNFCVIQTHVCIGDFFTCNDHVEIGHDTIIGNNVHINPSVNITGGAIIGNNTFIGVKATILRRKIGKNCIVGACTLITKDIPDNSKCKGIPAQIYPSDGLIKF